MPTAPVTPRRTFQILAGALMAALIVIGIALSFTVGHRSTDRAGHPVHTHAPGAWMYLVIAALGVVAAGLDQTVGYRMPALDPGSNAAATRGVALQAYQRSMFLRVGLSEAVAIIAIALVFSFRSNTILPYVLAALISELLMAYHVWPSNALIDRVQRRLDRSGGRSELAAIMSGTT